MSQRIDAGEERYEEMAHNREVESDIRVDEDSPAKSTDLVSADSERRGIGKLISHLDTLESK